MHKPKKKPERREEKSQSKLLAELTFAMLPDVHVYAVPNGGYRSKTEAVRMKSAGVKRGIADLVFVAPEWKTYWLEMKDGQRPLRDEQIGFGAICKRSGHPWRVARSVEEAMAVVREWGLLKKGR